MSEAGLWKDKIGISSVVTIPFVSKILDLWTRILQDLCLQDLHFKHNIHEGCLAAATARLNAVRARALAGFSTAFFGSLIPSERMVSVARSTQPPEYGANAGMPKRSVMVAAKESVTVSLPCTTKMWDGFFESINPVQKTIHIGMSADPLQGLQYGH